MSNSAKAVSMDIYAKMQSEQPYKTFKKTIPSIVEVKVFNDSPENVRLECNPTINDIDCFVPLWSEKEYLFFKRQNREHIEYGRRVESEYPVEEEMPKSPNSYTEEELVELVNGPFFAMKKAVEAMTSEAALYRVVRVGETEEGPEKTIKFLRESL